MAKNRREHLLRMGDTEKLAHRYSENPFTKTWEPDTVTKYRKANLGAGDLRLVNPDGEEVDGKALVAYQRDPARFIKTYHDNLPKLGLLSQTARIVLDFVMYQALPNRVAVWLPKDEGCLFCRFKQHRSFYDGVSELILYDYLAKASKLGFYFINPRFIFTGSREHCKQELVKPKTSFQGHDNEEPETL